MGNNNLNLLKEDIRNIGLGKELGPIIGQEEFNEKEVGLIKKKTHMGGMGGRSNVFQYSQNITNVGGSINQLDCLELEE